MAGYARAYKKIHGIQMNVPTDSPAAFAKHWTRKLINFGRIKDYEHLKSEKGLGEKGFKILFSRAGFYDTFLKEYWLAYKKMIL